MQFKCDLPVWKIVNGLEIINYAGGLWVDGHNVGQLFGYRLPRNSIITLYNRHKSKFRADETCRYIQGVPDKNDRTQRREIRLFSVPQGFMRLCFLTKARNSSTATDRLLETVDAIFEPNKDKKCEGIEEACWIDGIPCYTSKSIGEFLGASHPQKYIDKLVTRYPQIKEYAHEKPIKVKDKTYKIRVFSIAGISLIIMFSGLPLSSQLKVRLAMLDDIETQCRSRLVADALLGTTYVNDFMRTKHEEISGLLGKQSRKKSAA